MLKPQEKWPVILNSSLENSGVMKALITQQQKIRTSKSTLENTCIFPQSGIAFLVLHASEAYQDVALWKSRIEKLAKVHRNCYLILISATHSRKEFELTDDIQKVHMFTRLHIIPAHNDDEGVQEMLTIAKVTCKPCNLILKGKLGQVSQRLMSPSNMIRTFGITRLTENDCIKLAERFTTLKDIILATPDELTKETGLSGEAAEKFFDFFKPAKTATPMQKDAS